MKIIFLDIDGVLNCQDTTETTPIGAIGIDDNMVARLQQIVEQTGAKIVLSSTWKMWWSKNYAFCEKDGKYMVDKLAAHGLEIMDKISSVLERGDAIVTWLNDHPDVEAWIVLDDDVFPDFKTAGIMPHLVKTSFSNGGLLDRHVKKAIKLLN